MTQHHRQKAVSRQIDDPPSGFERTLSPSGSQVASDAALEPSSPYGETPVSGVVRSGASKLRAMIPVSRVTWDADEPIAPRDTQRDERLAVEAVLAPELTLDFASEYIPPQPLPQPAQHKTFELSPVRLDPGVHPRTAPTVLNARTQKRHSDKRQKDAREFDAFVAQAHRRRRLPWLVVTLMFIVGFGFALGAGMLGSPVGEMAREASAVQPASTGGARVTNASSPESAMPESRTLAGGPAQGELAPLGPRKTLTKGEVQSRAEAEPTVSPSVGQASYASSESSSAESQDRARDRSGTAAPNGQPAASSAAREVWLE